MKKYTVCDAGSLTRADLERATRKTPCPACLAWLAANAAEDSLLGHGYDEIPVLLMTQIRAEIMAAVCEVLPADEGYCSRHTRENSWKNCPHT